MLVLERKVDEAVSMGEDVTVVVSDIGPNWVKLAFDAPRQVKILRTELIRHDNPNGGHHDTRDDGNP